MNEFSPDAQRQSSSLSRREFVAAAGSLALAAGGSSSLATLWGAGDDSTEGTTAESRVRLLYDSLAPAQKRVICYDWDHVDPVRGLLRTHVANHWKVSPPRINGDFYTPDQRVLIRDVFDGITAPDWHRRFERQFRDDCGGFGEDHQIGIFGTPGGSRFECVLSGRHMTLRCDGNSAEHVAFGGPIMYGHSAEGFFERRGHPGNVFWEQALEANRLYQMLDGRQRHLALVRTGVPEEHLVGFRGGEGSGSIGPGHPDQPVGIPIPELSDDQAEELQRVLAKLLEPFRQSDRDEVIQCLKVRGGLEKCSMAFYQQSDIGSDGVWDSWRLEGPSFVWHFRGKPHVHVWVHVASDSDVRLNSHNDSTLE